MKEQPPTVLIIEDQEEVSALITYWLRRNGYRVESAKDGLEGIRRAKQIVPDLIVCDIGLPELNGLEVLAVLRIDPLLREIPFILMSGFSMARCGFPMPDAFLRKPFTPADLMTVVQDSIAPVPGQIDVGPF